MNKTSIVSDYNSQSLKIKKQLIKTLKNNKIQISGLLIVIGGDGFMLKTLKKNKNLINYFME